MGVGQGRDFTIFATKPGFVSFERTKVKVTNKGLIDRKFINVVDVNPNPLPEQDIR
jgi:ribosomal protein L27